VRLNTLLGLAALGLAFGPGNQAPMLIPLTCLSLLLHSVPPLWPNQQPQVQRELSYDYSTRVQAFESKCLSIAKVSGRADLVLVLPWNTQSFNTSYNVSVSNNFTVTDDRANILAWLSPLDPKSRHQDIRDRRVENIGEWLLRTEEFRSWQDGGAKGEADNPVLFYYGDPGVGKTHIR